MKRRKLRGKKLLACGAVLGAASVLEACFCATANLVAPPETDAGVDAGDPGVDAGELGMDAGDPGMDAGDPGMDSGADDDAGQGDDDAGPAPTDALIFFFDGPIANLVAPPPDGSF